MSIDIPRHHLKISQKEKLTPFLFKVENYINDKLNNKPFIIYGPSGCGKSTIMASIAERLKNCGQDNYIVAIRFLGTSRLSSNMHSVYRTLIHQFSKLFNIERKIEFKNSIEARNYLFDKLSEATKEKIVIILDAIDQLNESDYHLAWMQYELPDNVKVIYSTLNDHGRILETLKNKLKKNNDNYYEINKIDSDEAIKQLERRLNNQKRILKPNQLNSIKECFKNTNRLHVKLIFDICVKWRSTYIPDTNIKLKYKNSQETIKVLFNDYEALYGEVLFKHFVFYLTIFRYGLSESELEDILSIDDKVLNETFNKYEPPIRRFPRSILIRIVYDLKEYLTQKEVDDTLVYSWFHRAFNEAAHEHCHNLLIKSNERDELLRNIIDYFTEKWREQAKQYKWLDNETKYAIRYTKSQELKVKFEKSIVYNKRKLNELLNMILLLNDYEFKIDCLIEYIYFNYEFMHCKAELNDLQFIFNIHTQLQDLYNQASMQQNEVYIDKARELLELSVVYKNCYGNLTAYPDSILHEVFSRANNKLMDKLKQTALSLNQTMLLPVYKYFEPDDSELLISKGNNMNSFVVFWCFNIPYILIANEYLQSIEIRIMNYLDASYINGEIVISKYFKQQSMHFVSLTPFFKTVIDESISHINYINGGFIYVANELEENRIFMKTYTNDELYFKKTNQFIQKIFLIGIDALFVMYMNSFEIINFSDTIESITVFKDNYEQIILDVKSTLPQNGYVFMPEYDSVKFAIICVLLQEQTFVYRYDKTENKVEKLSEISFKMNFSSNHQILRAYGDPSIFNSNNFKFYCHNISCLIDKYLTNKPQQSCQESIKLLQFNGNTLNIDALIHKFDDDFKLELTCITYDDVNKINKIKRLNLLECENLLKHLRGAESIQILDFYSKKIILSYIKKFTVIDKLSISVYDTGIII